MTAHSSATTNGLRRMVAAAAGGDDRGLPAAPVSRADAPMPMRYAAGLAPAEPLARLTAREREVLEQMARGWNNWGIAEALYVTEHAVEKHINAVFHKLDLTDASDVHRRVAAVLLLLGEGVG